MGTLPDEWLAPIIRTIDRFRASGIEPNIVLLPITGHSYTLPTTFMGIAVVWSEELRFPHVAYECR